MLMILFWLAACIFFSSIALLTFYQINKNKIFMYKRVAPFITSHVADKNIVDEENRRKKTVYKQFIQPFLVKLSTALREKMPKKKLELLEKRMQAAGRPFGLSAGSFTLIQYFLPVIIFLLLTFIYVPMAENPIKVFLLSAIGAIFAYVYPSYYLTAKSKQRVHLIERAMPDFFDMLNVSIEAGLGLDGALKKVCEQIESPLSSEFLYALEDMKLGKSRREAFTEIKKRVPSKFLNSVLTSIIQADQMGMGMSKVLRIQTTRIREKHRFDAKEKAMKAPVKMLFPMVLFIFPTLFIVLLGPVVINLITTFL